MSMPEVDQDLCTGCETCVSLSPDVFEMQGDKAFAYGADKADSLKDQIQEAIDTCPVEAIAWK
ncbi:MAG: ferredoxin [Nitrospirae bacterium]|nr:ferredoxin [Nitrospirota bacterium]